MSLHPIVSTFCECPASSVPMATGQRYTVNPGFRGFRVSALLRFLCIGFLMVNFLSQQMIAQQALTWEEIRQKFEASNPTLQAAQINTEESRAAQITAYLRPNPNFSLAADGVQISRNFGVWRPLSGVVETPGISYLHERQHKRE